MSSRSTRPKAIRTGWTASSARRNSSVAIARVPSDRRPPAALGLRYKDGDREPFSLLAEAELSTEGGSSDSRIYQTITATIAVGEFGRRTLFLTHDFELVGSLVLYGIGTDFKESFYISGFSEAFRCKDFTPGGREIEVFDSSSARAIPALRT